MCNQNSNHFFQQSACSTNSHLISTIPLLDRKFMGNDDNDGNDEDDDNAYNAINFQNLAFKNNTRFNFWGTTTTPTSCINFISEIRSLTKVLSTKN